MLDTHLAGHPQSRTVTPSNAGIHRRHGPRRAALTLPRQSWQIDGEESDAVHTHIVTAV